MASIQDGFDKSLSLGKPFKLGWGSTRDHWGHTCELVLTGGEIGMDATPINPTSNVATYVGGTSGTAYKTRPPFTLHPPKPGTKSIGLWNAFPGIASTKVGFYSGMIYDYVITIHAKALRDNFQTRLLFTDETGDVYSKRISSTRYDTYTLRYNSDKPTITKVQFLLLYN